MRRPRASLDVALLIGSAIATRFAGLGAKLFHHDESVSAWFVEQLIHGAGYHADPVYHGPLLYHLEAAVFLLAGAGEFQARVVPAAFGVLVPALLYYLSRPHLGRLTALLAGGLCVISPTFTYYSRFTGHDMLIAAFTLVMVFMPFEYLRTRRPRCLVWFGAALALAIDTKLNVYFILGSLFVYGSSFVVFRWREGLPLDVRRIPAFVRSNARWLVVAGLTFMAIIALLFASTLSYYLRTGASVVEAVLFTVYSAFVAGFDHWSDMHREGRLNGPFHFYIPILVIYEPAVILASLGALGYFMRERLQFLGTLLPMLIFEWVLLSVLPFDDLAGGAVRMERWHVLLASSLALAGGWSILSLWRAGRNLIACWMLVGVVQFLLYSYAGEKVPWLAVHLVLPWFIVSAAFMVDAWQALTPGRLRTGLAAAVLALMVVTARGTWILNTRNRSNPAEPLVQIEFSEDMRHLISAATDLSTRVDEAPFVDIENPIQWPFGWYLRGLPARFVSTLSASTTTPMLLAADGPPTPGLEARYERIRLGYHRFSRWIDNANDADLVGLVRFTVRHDHWGNEQTVYMTAWIRRDLVDEFGDLDSLESLRAVNPADE